MLETIQELEHEIDQFHKNIKDSNELMKILSSVVSATKAQTETFDTRARSLQDELGELPPELNSLFEKKISEFVEAVHDEHLSYQDAVAKLMEGYSQRVAKAESSLSEVPSALNAQLQKDRAENIADLKQIQQQYAAELSKTNEAFTRQLQLINENIQAVPGQIEKSLDRQYSTFFKELDIMIKDRLVQLSDTEKHVIDLSRQLEIKYDSFITKLETTNMDQLYKYCQDMNKSIKTKLDIALGGVAVAVIVSIISLII